jgi:hypothetical protein
MATWNVSSAGLARAGTPAFSVPCCAVSPSLPGALGHDGSVWASGDDREGELGHTGAGPLDCWAGMSGSEVPPGMARQPGLRHSRPG